MAKSLDRSILPSLLVLAMLAACNNSKTAAGPAPSAAPVTPSAKTNSQSPTVSNIDPDHSPFDETDNDPPEQNSLVTLNPDDLKSSDLTPEVRERVGEELEKQCLVVDVYQKAVDALSDSTAAAKKTHDGYLISLAPGAAGVLLEGAAFLGIKAKVTPPYDIPKMPQPNREAPMPEGGPKDLIARTEDLVKDAQSRFKSDYLKNPKNFGGRTFEEFRQERIIEIARREGINQVDALYVFNTLEVRNMEKSFVESKVSEKLAERAFAWAEFFKTEAANQKNWAEYKRTFDATVEANEGIRAANRWALARAGGAKLVATGVAAAGLYFMYQNANYFEVNEQQYQDFQIHLANAKAKLSRAQGKLERMVKLMDELDERMKNGSDL